MARSKVKSEDEELEDLVDELDELEDEVEDEDEDVEEDEDLDDELDDDEDDEDEDPDEAPKAKRSRSKKSAAKKERTGIGTTEVAAEAGTTPRQLRMFLRSKGYQPRDDREGRYEWPSLRDPEVREIIKAVRGGAAKKVAKENIDKLKGKSAAKSASKTTVKKTTVKKNTARKRRAKADA